MADAFIYDHVRTPRGRGRPNGALHEIPPVDLAAQTLAALRRRNQLRADGIDDIVLGISAPVHDQGGVLPRAAALRAGFDIAVPGQQVSRFCASGLDAVNVASALVMAGQADMVIAGGVESMSRVRMGADGGAWQHDPAIVFETRMAPQGIGADLIATLNGFTREDVDAYAVQSQARAAQAWNERRFDRSVEPVKDAFGHILLDHDEHMRPGTSMADLAKLAPVFAEPGQTVGYDAVAIQRYPQVEAIDHVHTAGNSSGIVDGAAAMLIGTAEAGRANGLKPRARIRSFAAVGTDPTIMLTGPAPAAEKALRRAGMAASDIDLFELNEAFASVVLLFMRQFDLSPEQINVNGGSIAMGHPLGATGTMILGTVLDELERRDASTALVNLCVAVGMGCATVIERV